MLAASYALRASKEALICWRIVKEVMSTKFHGCMKPTDGAAWAISRMRRTTSGGRGVGRKWRISRRVRMIRYSASRSASENESIGASNMYGQELLHSDYGYRP